MRPHPRLAFCLAILGAAGLALPAVTQPAWPARPLRLIVPFPPAVPRTPWRACWPTGSGTRLGQTVVVENRAVPQA
jgi:tripartite-type tricarboxylate transporter receptor subunit TctC